MSNEDTSSGQSEMQTSDTPATGPNAPGGATPQKPAATSEATDARIAELERALKNATEERDRHRKKLSGYEEAEKKAAEAQLSEIERVNKKHSDLRAEYDAYVRMTHERLVRYEVERQAAKLNIIDPDAAAKLLDWSQLEYDEEGTPKNAQKLLEQLVKNKPYLVPAPTQQEPETPAQTVGRSAPTIPAMNPGRTSIAAPGTTPPSKIPRLSDPGVLVPPGTVSKYQP